MALRAVCLAVLLALAPPLAAQPLSQGEPVIRSPILSINYDRFFSGSQLGRALVAELEAERILLEAENRKIEAELEAEEVELTDLRDTGCVHVLCGSGARAALAADTLRAMGYQASVIEGGFEAWKAKGLPVEI